MQTIFITGASSGLGKAAAELFHANGWRVIATMRNPEKETELNQLERVTLLPLDVTRAEQVRETVGQAMAMGVDVVLNNAGYGLVGGFEAYTEEQITRQLDTNLLGVFRVAQPFVTYFREHHRKGLFLTVTSAAGIAANPLASIYSATKFALEGWSEAMNYEANQFGIYFKTIAPGAMNTDYVGRSLSFAAHDAYMPLWNKMISGFEDGSTNVIFSDPAEIAEVIYEAATDDKSQRRYLAGPDAIALSETRQHLGIEAHSEQIQGLYKII
ncbi:SDR family NAD(P)-dependent oxidoreductase [Pontibacter harenae]|uniref:SDR family NAD(P)-dependent oxidoreductase n=1 Tax=Pontibacter harenae TaxID=2894083 RepID=UPI001E59DE61|nr:SDR family NAD(P)-dependent oxidoreductase [Pontibacter harenae]MCC9168867.1 SDR family NAD(P)-dependent oxidoreductase [Pontibacter harenae]